MRNTISARLVAATSLALLTGLVGQAQTSVVVPATFSTTEAPNVAFWAVSPFVARRQLLIDESHLPGLRGKHIRAIWMRSNSGDRSSLKAGSVGLEVSLSLARCKAEKAQQSFALNRGAKVEVAFTGVIALPAMTAPNKGPAPWNVEIRLTKPFLYGGGTLCIETVTTPNKSPASLAPAWWPIDAVTGTSGGTVSKIGTSCIRGMGQQPAGANASGFVPGSTATVHLRGRTNSTTAVCSLGMSSALWGATQLPMNLRGFGAPGCHIYVELLVSVSVPLKKRPDLGISYGSWSLQLPPFGLATSNGVRAVIGSPTALSGVSWVESPNPKNATGSVLKGRLPVLRFVAK